jgi:Tfp pilus assembly protein PilO
MGFLGGLETGGHGMTGILDKLNLSPSERRLVVVVSLVVFVVLNIWLVWPEFGSVGVWEQRRTDAQRRLKQFKDEIAKKPDYERRLRELESAGVYIPGEDQALALLRDVANEASKSGVTVERFNPMTRTAGGRTNAFFEEQTLVISVIAKEEELVAFLYNLGSSKSLIRVKGMSLQPDPSRMKLRGDITLVESFQKKPPPKAPVTAPAKTTNQPARTTPTPSRPTNAPPQTQTRAPGAKT